jgi:hypothetical protein
MRMESDDRPGDEGCSDEGQRNKGSSGVKGKLAIGEEMKREKGEGVEEGEGSRGREAFLCLFAGGGSNPWCLPSSSSSSSTGVSAAAAAAGEEMAPPSELDLLAERLLDPLLAEGFSRSEAVGEGMKMTTAEGAPSRHFLP